MKKNSNPKPHTQSPNSKLQTPNPNQLPQNLKPQTLDPKYQTPNHEPRRLKPKAQFVRGYTNTHTYTHIHTHKHTKGCSRKENRDRNSKPETWTQKPGTLNLRTRNPKPETPNPEPQTPKGEAEGAIRAGVPPGEGGSRVELKNSRRPCLVAYRATLPQKWPPSPGMWPISVNRPLSLNPKSQTAKGEVAGAIRAGIYSQTQKPHLI